MDDFVRSLRLCHVLDNVDLVGYSLAPVDWTDPVCYAETLCRSMCMTDKPLEYPVAEQRQLPVVLQMAEILFGGDWHELPRDSRCASTARHRSSLTRATARPSSSLRVAISPLR